jgi:hypothetical protein
MSLARYLSKLGAMLGSDGKVPAAALGAGAARANFGAGAVLQVVTASYSSGISSTSTTWIDTGVSASITPSSSTSKILVLVDQAVEAYASNVTGLGLRLMRDATAIKTTDSTQGGSVNAAVDIWSRAPLNLLDSPATTSAVTYKTQFRRAINSDGPYGNYAQVQRGGDPSTIILLEIAG